MKTTTMLLACLSASSGCIPPPGHNGDANGNPAESASAISNKDAYYAQQLPILLAKNPEADAQAAIARGERYFLCNAGRSTTVPGISPEVFTRIRNNCPIQCLDGVTDALYGPNHHRYLDAALDYSARWNRIMLSVCQ